MKTNLNSHRVRVAFSRGETRTATLDTLAFLRSAFGKTLAAIVLVLLAFSGVHAQTFVKQIDGAGVIEPLIFRDATATDYYMTARRNDSTFITKFDAAGNLMGTHILHINNDDVTITDMIVDNVDGTLAGVAKGTLRNYMFKYNFITFSFDWVTAYPSNYIFQNIHQVDAARYIATGQLLTSRITIVDIDRTTGGILSYQNDGFVGEFFSTYDGANVIGACRWYGSGSLFHPSLYRYDPGTGLNTWTRTYVVNPPATTCRIYPVAPIVDGGRIVQLSSGNDAAFNTYLTGPTSVWLLQTDMAGALIWTKRITIPGYARLNAKKIINTATGYYLLIDAYNGAMVNYFFVIKTDKAGNFQWANRYGIAGVNTVLSGVEDNGDLWLTALSGSFNPGSNTLLLKLDPSGMSDPNCQYIVKVNASIVNYNNTQLARPTPNTAITFPPANPGNVLDRAVPTEAIYCFTNPPGTLPCNTLTGSLASGVLAFYPFGNGSLLDVSGNNNHLTTNSGAVPTVDRDGNSNCAYNFNWTNFLSGNATFLDNMTTAPFSISLWYQPLDATRPVGSYELLVGRGNTGLHCPDTWGEWSVGLYDCRKAVVGFDMNSHWETPTTSLTCQQYLAAVTNVWHHLAFVYDGASGYDLYVDGVLYQNSHGPCGWMSGNIGQLMMGVDYGGDLDDVIIYNRAITPAEVFALMALNGSCCDGVFSSNKSSGNNEETGVAKLAEENVDAAISIYPNPTDGEVHISSGKGKVQSVSVFNMTGALVGTYHFDQEKVSVNIDHLPSGIYMIKVTTASGSSMQKLIRN